MAFDSVPPLPVRPLHILGVAIGFSLVGPAFGSLPFLLLAIFAFNDSADLFGLFGLLIFAYMFGWVPALVTGIAAGYLFRRFDGSKWCIYSGLAGFVVASGFCLFLGFGDPGLTFDDVLKAVVGFGLPGLLGGALSACLVQYVQGKRFFNHRVRT